MAAPLLPLLGAVARGAVGMGARGAGMATLRGGLAKRAMGGLYRASGASRVPAIEKAVDAASRGYDAYKEFKERQEDREQEHHHTFESDPREKREEENRLRQEEAHEEGIRAETDKKFEESTAVLEVMAKDIHDIKNVMLGDGEKEGGIMGKVFKGLIGAFILKFRVISRPLMSVLSKVQGVVAKVAETFTRIVSGIAKTRLGRMMGLGAINFGFAGAAAADEGGPSDTPINPDTGEPMVADVPSAGPSFSRNLTAAAMAVNPAAGLGMMLGRSLFRRRRRPETIEPEVEQTIPSPIQPESSAGPLGGLSRRYESRGSSSAIGYDSTGGTSYGKYQIASKTGTMDNFLEFVKDRAPEVYERLSAAGPSNTGRAGGRFAEVWKELVEQGKMGDLEHQFIRSTHYDVSRKGLKSGLGEMVDRSKALQEVLWSTSVQHGGSGGASIFNRVYKDGMSEEDLIRGVYDYRRTQFSSSTPRIRQSVMRRFDDESSRALSLLEATPSQQGPSLAESERRERSADRQSLASIMPVPVPAVPAQPMRQSPGAGSGPQVPMIVRSNDDVIRANQLSYISRSA